MRKTQFICVMIFLISVVCNITAAVNYVEKDGDIEVIITYDNPSLPAVNIIGTMTENWREPGHSMKKNSDGVWEYRYVMERSRDMYKFFDPSKSGAGAYIEDPAAVESAANPFGSRDAIIRKPLAGQTIAAEVYPRIDFGFWSRSYYLAEFGSNLSRKIEYDESGKLKRDVNAVEDNQLGRKWRGEFNTTEGNATRLWLNRTQFRSQSTVKFHGKALKHMQVDAEINLKTSVDTSYDNYWNASDKTSRYEALEEINRSMGSQFIGLLFAPLAVNGVWGRWLATKTGDWDHNYNCIWIDQLIISFPFDGNRPANYTLPISNKSCISRVIPLYQEIKHAKIHPCRASVFHC